jgi:modulator of FtsH protease HflC
MRALVIAWLMCVVAVAAVLGSSLFVVNEGEQAIRTRFGVVQQSGYGPGLHACWPFDRIVRVDGRISTLALQGETFLTSEQQGLLVDLALHWRVDDAVRFDSAVGADDQRAAGQLADALRSELKAAWAGRTLAQLLAAPHGGVDAALLAKLAARASELGLHVVDVQVARIDPTEDSAQAIYRRMQAAYGAEAAQVRAEAQAGVDRIRAEADRARAELIAAATRDSQRLRGEGEASAAAIYARSYGRNPEFAAFWRSLQAYRTALGREGDVLVIQPDGDFYKYLRSPARH